MAIQSFLTFKRGGKAIPYGGFGEVREDGGANHGFKNLKGHPERIADVPELVADGALAHLVEVVNRPSGALFTVGCVSGIAVQPGQGYYRTGYVEVAFNSKEQASDLGSYMDLFAWFSEWCWGTVIGVEARLIWEIEGATFIFEDFAGLTCAIFIQTQPCTDEPMAEMAWKETLDVLANFMRGVLSDGQFPRLAKDWPSH